jgi:D-proline reductase (dithiol) PrdB
VQDGRGINFAEFERDYVRGRVYAPFDWHPFDDFSPHNPLRVPVADARVAFVTTGGVHLPSDPPFDVRADTGDPSWRAFPADTPLAELTLTHRGYDTGRASADKNVVLPLDHLRAFAAEGRIGSLSPDIHSFMGYVAETDRLLWEEAPAVAERLLADGVDLVLLAPT